MKEILQEYSVHIFTVYIIGIVLWGAQDWTGLLPFQQVTVIASVLLCIREWEKQRHPGGFAEMMFKIMGIAPAPAQKHALNADMTIFAFAMSLAAVMFTQLPVFSCALMILGIMAGIVQVADVKFGKCGRPYSPGMVSSILFAGFSVVAMVKLILLESFPWFFWLIGGAWVLVAFTVAKVLTWKSFGIAPGELLRRYRKGIGKEGNIPEAVADPSASTPAPIQAAAPAQTQAAVPAQAQPAVQYPQGAYQAPTQIPNQAYAQGAYQVAAGQAPVQQYPQGAYQAPAAAQYAQGTAYQAPAAQYPQGAAFQAPAASQYPQGAAYPAQAAQYPQGAAQAPASPQVTQATYQVPATSQYAQGAYQVSAAYPQGGYQVPAAAYGQPATPAPAAVPAQAAYQAPARQYGQAVQAPASYPTTPQVPAQHGQAAPPAGTQVYGQGA